MGQTTTIMESNSNGMFSKSNLCALQCYPAKLYYPTLWHVLVYHISVVSFGSYILIGGLKIVIEIEITANMNLYSCPVSMSQINYPPFTFQQDCITLCSCSFTGYRTRGEKWDTEAHSFCPSDGEKLSAQDNELILVLRLWKDRSSFGDQ